MVGPYLVLIMQHNISIEEDEHYLYFSFAFIDVFIIIGEMSERDRPEITVVVPKGGSLRVLGSGEASENMARALGAINKVIKNPGLPGTSGDGKSSEGVIRGFVREHGESMIRGISGRIDDEFGQSSGESAPFAQVVQAARADGLSVGDVRRIVGDEIEHSHVDSEDREWTRDTITYEMASLARRDYPIPEHDFYGSEE